MVLKFVLESDLGRNLLFGTVLNVGGVIAYPVMQAYGSLAFENNSEVGEAMLIRRSISCVCPSQKVDPHLTIDLLDKGLVIFPTCELGVAGSILGRIHC